MAKYIVVHGSIKTGSASVHVGEPIEMSDEDKASVDPEGRLLVTPEVFEALKQQAEAQERLEAAMKKNAESSKPVSAKALAAITARKKLEGQMKKATKPPVKEG